MSGHLWCYRFWKVRTFSKSTKVDKLFDKCLKVWLSTMFWSTFRNRQKLIWVIRQMQKYVPFRYSDLLFEIDKTRYELFDRCLGQNIVRNRQKSIWVIRSYKVFLIRKTCGLRLHSYLSFWMCVGCLTSYV